MGLTGAGRSDPGAPGISEFEVSAHAVMQTQRRGITIDLLHLVLTRPEQRWQVRPGRDVFQSRIQGPPPSGRPFLARVFVDVDRIPPLVVTAYLTSHVARYWRTNP